MRSFRAENVSGFVKAILDCEVERARSAFEELRDKYPICLTREPGHARRWIRRHARGSERYGLVASSEAQRLKPHAIDVRANIDPVLWFLIFVPEGTDDDPTRKPEFYDATFAYLRSVGIPVLDSLTM